MKNILVTGSAGFIGFHLVKKLLNNPEYNIIGLDNLNSYYDTKLKLDRLEELGISPYELHNNSLIQSRKYKNFSFIKLDLTDMQSLTKLFDERKISIICNLAAQPGVRYGIENPRAFIDSNLVGFFNIIECCRNYKIEHFIYASSSSVYGLNEKIPFSTEDRTDEPASLYAATKKSNELMAHSYSYLFNIPMTCLRFFTVYGPWGRPDMAMFKFTDAIIKGEAISIYNNGEMERDFTYVDDVVDMVSKIINKGFIDKETTVKHNTYNVGHNKPVKLMKFIEIIETKLGITAIKEFKPLQAGDVIKTWANCETTIKDYGFDKYTDVEVGIKIFIEWYKSYFKAGN
jgi:UDP-glucuronate 4-epimerase